MRRKLSWVVLVLLVATTGSSCSAAGATAAPTPKAVATSYADYHAAFCGAWESVFLAVGNPDTGGGSDLTRQMDSAIETGDMAAVDQIAGQIRAELETARVKVAYASGFDGGAKGMAAMDKLIVAFEALVEAKRAAAGEGLAAATEKGQAALRAAGGGDAWETILTADTWASVRAAQPPDVPSRCENVPISL
jgi:hypothetical protein